MSSNRIATFPSANNIIAQSLKLQSDYNTANTQTASGVKSQYYSGIAGDAQQLINLNSQSAVLTAYSTNITNATNKLNVIQGSISGIGDLLSSIKSQLTSYASGTNASTSGSLITAQANTWKTQLQSLLNTQYAGEYVFGGSVTDSPPVDLSAAGYNPSSFSTADTTYYQGNATIASVRASQDLTVSYGITADNSAFEQVFRALTLLAASPTNASTMSSTIDVMQSSVSAVADMSAQLSTNANILESEGEMHSATLDHLNTSISSLRDVDVAAASARLSQLSTQLQASYSALALVLKLNLSQYLR